MELGQRAPFAVAALGLSAILLSTTLAGVSVMTDSAGTPLMATDPFHVKQGVRPDQTIDTLRNPQALRDLTDVTFNITNADRSMSGSIAMQVCLLHVHLSCASWCMLQCTILAGGQLPSFNKAERHDTAF